MAERADTGSVTAETAVVLPVLVLVVAVLFGVTRGVDAALSVQDAARIAARAAARGEPAAEVQRVARSVAPSGASVTVTHPAGLIEVVVRAMVRPLGAGARFVPVLEVAARAVAAAEADPATQAGGPGGVP